MLIVALVLAVISLAALVTAVVTSNEMIAWACIGFSALGVVLLIVDAVRDRNRRPASDALAFDRSEAAAAGPAAEATEVMAPVNVAGHRDAVDVEVEDNVADVDVADVDVAEVDVADVDVEDDEEIVEYPAEAVDGDYDGDYLDEAVVEDHPEEIVYDDPDHDLPNDDEPDYPVAAEEAAIHIISETELESVTDGPSYVVTDESSYVVTDGSSYVVTEEPSYMVSESPTVSYAGSAEDSAIVIYSSEIETGNRPSEDSEEPGGER